MSGTLVKSKEHKISKRDDFVYITEQMELLKTKFQLPATMVETHEVRQEGKYFILSKREKPIQVFDFDADGHQASIVQSQQLYTNRMFGSKKRGKYNDEDRFENVHGVEVGETQDMIGEF